MEMRLNSLANPLTAIEQGLFITGLKCHVQLFGRFVVKLQDDGSRFLKQNHATGLGQGQHELRQTFTGQNGATRQSVPERQHDEGWNIGCCDV